jgi:hypothetical protein
MDRWAVRNSCLLHARLLCLDIGKQKGFFGSLLCVRRARGFMLLILGPVDSIFGVHVSNYNKGL